MVLQCRTRPIVRPKLGVIRKSPRPDLFDYVRRDSDVGYLDGAAMPAARQQHMACLAAKERDGPRCIHGGAHNCTARSVDPTWQIDRNDRTIAGIHRLDHHARQSFDVATEARAEQSIYDDIATGQSRRRCLLNCAAPAGGGNRSITLQRLRLANKAEPNKKTIFGQTTGSDKTVPTIIAGTCHDGDAVAQHFGRCIGDCSTGTFHEIYARNAAGHGKTVCFRHLVGRKQFNHRSRTYWPAATIRTNRLRSTKASTLAKM